jgi:hypothetical protein
VKPESIVEAGKLGDRNPADATEEALCSNGF